MSKTQNSIVELGVDYLHASALHSGQVRWSSILGLCKVFQERDVENAEPLDPVGLDITPYWLEAVRGFVSAICSVCS